MKSKDQKRREAIDRMEISINVPQINKFWEPKDDVQRRKNVQKAIDNTKAKLKGDSYGV